MPPGRRAGHAVEDLSWEARRVPVIACLRAAQEVKDRNLLFEGQCMVKGCLKRLYVDYRFHSSVGPAARGFRR